MAFVAAGAAALMMLSTSQKTVRAQQRLDIVTSGPVDVQAVTAQTLSYWTSERMATAIHAPLMHTSASSPQSVDATAVTATPRGVAGVKPGQTTQGAVPLVGGDTGLLAVPYHTQIPFTRWQYFAVYKRYPIYPVGKLFFTNNGIDYVCSGSVIYVNVVWTAGHCVANTDSTHQTSTNLLFCPVYDTGANPGVGCWAGIDSVTWAEWSQFNSFEWDMGVIRTTSCGTQNCTDIGNITGSLGFLWNAGYEQHWMHFGYPQGAPFNGNKIQVCASEFGYQDSDGNNQGGPNSAASGCDETGGSSGGPWIVSWGLPGQVGGGAGNYLNGHQDWYHTDFPTEINSPYFDSRACQLAEMEGVPLGPC